MTDLQERSRLYVARARRRKAETMAFLLWASNILPDDVERMNAQQWSMLAHAAGTNEPSQETRILTYRRLLEYQEGRAYAA